jgi:hypothetical protein
MKEKIVRDWRKLGCSLPKQTLWLRLSRSPLPAGSPLDDPSRCRRAVDGVSAAREAVPWKKPIGGSLDVCGTWKRHVGCPLQVADTPPTRHTSTLQDFFKGACAEGTLGDH